MKNLLPIVFASIAAIGNAMFALGQKKASGVENGLLFALTFSIQDMALPNTSFMQLYPSSPQPYLSEFFG